MRIVFLICFFAWVNPVSAQLCHGSLGDPIVNIDFGSGPEQGNSLSAATTAYTFSPADCPRDGSYTVRTKTAGCFDETWHDVNSDHTQNVNGYFMLVNASYQPNDFYLDTVHGLCSNTTYELAAWIMNITEWGCNNNPIKPDLTFSIETLSGTVLKVYNTGSIPMTTLPEWKQYGTFFSTTSMINSVVLRIRNNAPGGCGNDLALDDITFRPCGPLITPSISGEPSASKEYCEGAPQTFTLTAAVSGGYSSPVYQWQKFSGGAWLDISGATQLNYLLQLPASTSPGNYLYRLLVAESGNMNISTCRVASLPVTITVKSLPVITVNNPGNVCEGIALTISASGGTTYQWSGPGGFASADDTIHFNSVSPGKSGNYSVIITNSEGCSVTETTLLNVYSSPSAIPGFTDSTICSGESVNLFVQPTTGFTYEWSPSQSLDHPGNHDPEASPVSDTRYSVYVTNANGCSDTTYINVFVKSLPVVNAGADKFKVGNQPVKLDGSISGDYSFFKWSPELNMSNANSLSPQVNPLAEQIYYLKATSACGEVTDSVTVKYFSDVFIPNAFTPNNDGINDSWMVPVLYADPAFKLSIFNRYGQLLYVNERNYIPWKGIYKGQPLPAGVYIYMISVHGEILKGTVTLIR